MHLVKATFLFQMAVVLAALKMMQVVMAVMVVLAVPVEQSI